MWPKEKDNGLGIRESMVDWAMEGSTPLEGIRMKTAVGDKGSGQRGDNRPDAGDPSCSSDLEEGGKGLGWTDIT